MYQRSEHLTVSKHDTFASIQQTIKYHTRLYHNLLKLLFRLTERENTTRKLMTSAHMIEKRPLISLEHSQSSVGSVFLVFNALAKFTMENDP